VAVGRKFFGPRWPRQTAILHPPLRRPGRPSNESTRRREIKRGYRKRAKRRHPWRLSGKTRVLVLKFGSVRDSPIAQKAWQRALYRLFGRAQPRDRTWWLARQCRWPPALPVFPANREFYREFYKIAALGTPETASNGVVTALPTQISYSTKQGIILAEQGFSPEEQGILPVKIEFITTCDFSEKEP